MKKEILFYLSRGHDQMTASGKRDPGAVSGKFVEADLVEVVSIGTVKLEEVPVEYRAEVENRLPVSEEEQWARDIMEEVSEYGY